MTIWIVLIICSYLLGSVPSSYLVARARGIDLRKDGTQQVGGGNLWRTTSRKLGLIVGIFDFFKGMLMVLIALKLGLDAGQQLAVGLAAVVGHNWPVFLRFYGGRGVATSLGIIIILPLINDITPWATIAFFAVGAAVITITRRSPVPIFVAMVILPITSAISREPLSVTMGFLAMALIIIIKRLTAQSAIEARNIGMGHLLLNRLLFDRDIGDRTTWVHRKHIPKKEKKE
ncbi:MAG: glycerol-3-phosphate acyltransferase [Dehalococcoidales bacterium]|nr:glycerol-3-phosphate acyltransferase [Dehalococcoidales bacterium]